MKKRSREEEPILEELAIWSGRTALHKRHPITKKFRKGFLIPGYVINKKTLSPILKLMNTVSLRRKEHSVGGELSSYFFGSSSASKLQECDVLWWQARRCGPQGS